MGGQGLVEAAGEAARGAILFCTLEPCCHHGKTGPCAEAVINAGIRQIYIGIQDPAPHVDGGGIALLEAAGVQVEVGLLHDEITRMNGPFIKLMTERQPFLIGKWAMTLDGKLAAHTGASQWISNEHSRKIVHDIRQRVDGILVGSGTVFGGVHRLERARRHDDRCAQLVGQLLTNRETFFFAIEFAQHERMRHLRRFDP